MACNQSKQAWWLPTKTTAVEVSLKAQSELNLNVFDNNLSYS